MAERTLRCAGCGAHVVPHDEHGVEFRCPACGAVAVATDRDAPVRVGRRGDLKRLDGVDLAKFTIDLDGPNLLVSWRWDRFTGAAFLVIASLFGAPLLFCFLFPLTRAGELADQGAFSLVGLVLAVPFLFALHQGLSRLLNRTEIAVDDGTLSVWHGPIPAHLSRRVPLGDLDELRVRQNVRRGNNGNVQTTYELYAVRLDGTWVRLLPEERGQDTPAAVKRLLDTHLDALNRGAAPLSRTVPIPRSRARVKAPASAEVPPAITLSCPKCGGTLDPPPERAEMTCRFCSARVPIPKEVQRALDLRPARAHDRAKFRATFDARKQDGAMIFSAAWPRAVGLFLAVVSLAAAAAATFGAVVTYWAGPDLFCLLLTTAAAGGAIWAGYVAACYLWNRTTVTVTREAFRVVHGPLPWARPAVVPTDRVTQLVVREEHVFRGWHGERHWRGWLGERHWTLLALADHGANLALFGQIPDREALETLEHLVERRLGIRDQAVRG